MRKFTPALALAVALALGACTTTTPLQAPVSEAAQSLMILDFSPRSGGPGTVVTITGSGFDAKVPSNNLVMFNGVPGVVTSATETTIVATVPAGATLGAISLTLNGKTVSTDASYATMQTIKTVMGKYHVDGLPVDQTSIAPWGIAQDPQGNLIVADWNGRMVYRVSPDGKVSTLAGIGLSGHTGDGGPARAARLSTPAGVTVDSAGNVYVAEPYGHVVRKITPAGTISTVAGTGASGFSGDDRAATSTNLYQPTDVAVDAAGNLYIADSSNHRIRKVATDGTITTVAGTGEGGYGGDGGLATGAKLSSPQALALDSQGNLYIADTYNHRIRKVATDGTITTVAGNGLGGFSGDGGAATLAKMNQPLGIALDEDDNLYIADYYNFRIRKVTAADGKISTLAGTGSEGRTGDGGPASAAKIGYLRSLFVDASGNLLIADDSNGHALRKIAAADGAISTLMGRAEAPIEGPATTIGLQEPFGLAEDAQGNLYVGDASRNLVFKMTPSGQVTRVAGVVNDAEVQADGLAIHTRLEEPTGLVVDGVGNLYIADESRHVVHKVTPEGRISAVAGTGSAGYAGDGGPATSAKLNGPMALAMDAAGNLYIADSGNNRIRKVALDGTLTTVAGNGVRGFSGDGGRATLATLDYPTGVALDASGNLYISDTDNYRIRKVALDGTIDTIAGYGYTSRSYAVKLTGIGASPALKTSLHYPMGLTVDPAGNIYVAEYDSSQIRRISPEGEVSTVAGDGGTGTEGDHGPALHAKLNYPENVLWSRSGKLFVADTENGLIRAIGF